MVNGLDRLAHISYRSIQGSSAGVACVAMFPKSALSELIRRKHLSRLLYKQNTSQAEHVHIYVCANKTQYQSDGPHSLWCPFLGSAWGCAPAGPQWCTGPLLQSPAAASLRALHPAGSGSSGGSGGGDHSNIWLVVLSLLHKIVPETNHKNYTWEQ